MAKTFAILLVEPDRAQFRHFTVELRGDTLWQTGVEQLAARLKSPESGGLQPKLVAVVGDDADAAARVVEELKRLGVARVVLLHRPAPTAEEELCALVHQAIELGLINPLTKLPNTDALRIQVEQRLARREDFVFFQIDVDNFKAYNDKYNIARGDKAIQEVGRLLEEAVEERGIPTDLVAHIGGDDFALITGLTDEPDYLRLLDCIFAKRRERMPPLYDLEDQSRGYIEAVDRQRQLRRYPLMTISIGVVSTLTRSIKDYAQLWDYAKECKEQAKGIEGDSHFVDRRRDDGTMPTDPASN